MALTNAATGLTVQQWDANFFLEALSQNRFKREMGTSSNNIIQVKSDLTTKKGQSITYALVNKLVGAGVTGSGVLEGNEEDLISRSFPLIVDKIRNGVLVPEIEEQYSAIMLRDAGREALMDWMMEQNRDDIITALGMINGVPYGTATDGQKDAWLTDNADRVLFGDAVGNQVAGDQSASLLAVTAAMTFDSAALGIMKRMTQTADPKIRPVRTTEDERWYVCYTDSLCFRDINADPVINAANREAWSRGPTNPLFTGGDIIYDGIVIKEIPDIESLGTVGEASATVSPAYMCGAQAVAWGWAKKTTSKSETFDYGDKQGVAVEEIRGVAKMTFGSGAGDTDDQKDHGIVTGYFGAAADA